MKEIQVHMMGCTGGGAMGYCTSQGGDAVPKQEHGQEGDLEIEPI